MSRQDAIHLLRRVGFGGTEDEINSLTDRTRQECVDAVMGFTAGQPTPAGPDVGVPGFVGGSKQWEAHAAILDWWVARMASLSNQTVAPPPTAPSVAVASPLHEKMVLFWHDHFACGQDKVSDVAVMWDQIGMFRRLGLGSFEELLRQTSVHPAMLVFLDNETNVVDGVQENFGRELLELYTCGVGNYTEADVVAMARAWTGHGTVGWNGTEHDTTYVYRPDRHDHGAKTLFGITANWNGTAQHGSERDTIHELTQGKLRVETARFIAAKLFRWFAHPNPSPGVVEGLAQTFKNAEMDIATLMRAILLHDDFWLESTRDAQVKTPTEYVVSLAKRSTIPADDMGLRWRMRPMGQLPLDPPSVAGWGTGDVWLSTASAWGKAAFITNLRWRDIVDDPTTGLLAATRTMESDDDVADAIFELFGLEWVSPRTRQHVKHWHRRTKGSDKWAIQVQGFLLGALCPEFQVH